MNHIVMLKPKPVEGKAVRIELRTAPDGTVRVFATEGYVDQVILRFEPSGNAHFIDNCFFKLKTLKLGV